MGTAKWSTTGWTQRPRGWGVGRHARTTLLALALACVLVGLARAERFRLVTYNVERFGDPV